MAPGADRAGLRGPPGRGHIQGPAKPSNCPSVSSGSVPAEPRLQPRPDPTKPSLLGASAPCETTRPDNVRPKATHHVSQHLAVISHLARHCSWSLDPSSAWATHGPWCALRSLGGQDLCFRGGGPSLVFRTAVSIHQASPTHITWVCMYGGGSSILRFSCKLFRQLPYRDMERTCVSVLCCGVGAPRLGTQGGGPQARPLTEQHILPPSPTWPPTPTCCGGKGKRKAWTGWMGPGWGHAPGAESRGPRTWCWM